MNDKGSKSDILWDRNTYFITQQKFTFCKVACDDLTVIYYWNIIGLLLCYHLNKYITANTGVKWPLCWASINVLLSVLLRLRDTAGCTEAPQSKACSADLVSSSLWVCLALASHEWVCAVLEGRADLRALAIRQNRQGSQFCLKNPPPRSPGPLESLLISDS